MKDGNLGELADSLQLQRDWVCFRFLRREEAAGTRKVNPAANFLFVAVLCSCFRLEQKISLGGLEPARKLGSVPFGGRV